MKVSRCFHQLELFVSAFVVQVRLKQKELEMKVSKRKGKAATRSNASTSDEENQEWEVINDLEDKVELLREQKQALEESLKTLEEDLKDVKKDRFSSICIDLHRFSREVAIYCSSSCKFQNGLRCEGPESDLQRFEALSPCLGVHRRFMSHCIPGVSC